MRIAAFLVLSLAPLGQAGSPGHFVPAHRVSGIGVARDDISEDLLQARTDLMIQSQTFGILRDPLALPSAKRITSNEKLQALFRSASARSGLPASLIEAIAYLESWGDARAQSPSGPRGIMQISEATAHSMGLKVLHATRYRIVKERVQLASTGRKPKYRTITHKIPYTVPGRDDRMSPDRAVPAAARYLAAMEQKYGGRDWAIFAYHCGQGCVNGMIELTRRARGIPPGQVSVPRMFFSASPSWNRELYEAVQQEMQRDYSPTYYFRVKRAEQLLALYRRDPRAFEALAAEYRNQFASNRAPHRLAVWLKRDDLVFHSAADIRANPGGRLVPAFDRPRYFGYALQLAPGAPSSAAQSAIGTLAYVAFETRRLFEEMRPAGEEFRPLPVTSLVEPEEDVRQSGRPEALAHSSGQVFDIEISSLAPGELECLRFVLNDLGWEGYLGFVEDGRDRLHVGCSPGSREFFAAVYHEALAGPSADEVEGQESPGVRQDAHIGELQ